MKRILWFPNKCSKIAVHALLHILNPLVDINICTFHPHIQSLRKDLLHMPRLYVSVGYVIMKPTLKIIAPKWDHSF